MLSDAQETKVHKYMPEPNGLALGVVGEERNLPALFPQALAPSPSLADETAEPATSYAPLVGERPGEEKNFPSSSFWDMAHAHMVSSSPRKQESGGFSRNEGRPAAPDFWCWCWLRLPPNAKD
jgi:hypothetical protein